MSSSCSAIVGTAGPCVDAIAAANRILADRASGPLSWSTGRGRMRECRCLAPSASMANAAHHDVPRCRRQITINRTMLIQRIGIIGTGGMAEQRAGAFAQLGAAVGGVHGRDAG